MDWRMLRDVKRRKLAYEYADERLRINAIRKNTILPKELQVPGSPPRPLLRRPRYRRLRFPKSLAQDHVTLHSYR